MTEGFESKERCLAVFNNEVPDRAPVCNFGNVAMLSYYGNTLQQCRDDPGLGADIMSRWARDTGADMFFGPLETKGIFMDLPGLNIKMPENDQGSLADPYFKSQDDLDKPLYDPFNIDECPNFYRYVVDPLRLIHEACPEVMTPAWCEGVLTSTGFLRGVEDLLMMMLMEPDEAKKAIRVGADFSRDIVSAELEAFDADYVVCTDPVSSASMIDASMFKEFNQDLLKRNIDHWRKEYGKPTMLHICGNTEPMLSDFAEVGASATSLDHAVDMRKAKEALRGKSAVTGNLDPVSIMLNGNPSDVDRVAQECFENAGRDGGYIFAAGCAEPRGTPIENIRALVEVSKRNAY